MTLFTENKFNQGRVKVILVERWGLHWWSVEYSHGILFDRAGVNRSFEKAKASILKHLHRINQYEAREAERWRDGYDIG